jgi:tetratricopeptide (TPR) repeat protein
VLEVKYNHKLMISLVLLHSLTSGVALANTAQTNNSQNQPAPSKDELVLNYLMEAELAASRGLAKEALLNYLKVAELTNDPEIAELATEYALELRDAPAAMRAVTLWANNAPDSLEAQLIAVSLLIDTRPLEAKVFLQNVFKTEHPAIDENLLNILYKISEAGRKNLSSLTQEIADQNPNNLQAQLATADLFANQLMIKEAIPYLDKTFQLAPKCTGAIQLQAKLIRYESNSNLKALEYLYDQIKANPDDFILREFYTNALIDDGQTKPAVEQLKILAKDPEYGAFAAIQLGEYYLASNEYKNAIKYLNMALNNPATRDLAYYDLGQVAEYQNNPQKAIEWYLKIDPASEHQANAYLRAALLYAAQRDYDTALQLLQHSNPKNFAEQKQIILTQIDFLIDMQELEEAHNTANRVLAIIPDDLEFLYVRSLIRNNLHQYKLAEEDLLLVLQLEPNHANALNALACTLSNQDGRMKEAIVYIEQALVLAPNNPAFMDSKGWLLFKSGDSEQAIIILAQAYQLSPEALIATHYGEVLWITGKQNDAKKIWRKALTSNLPELNETLKRYNLTPQDL